MGGACRTKGDKERCITGFWWGNPKYKDHLNNIAVEEKYLNGST
jgi:hypothetical protein